jgi:hypothetical protein
MGSSPVDEGGTVFEFVIVVVVVIVTVGWLRARDQRPAGTAAPTPSGTTLGGSATWSSATTPAPADPDLDRLGDEHFIEGFVVGRYVTLAEQDRQRARDRAAFEAALPDDDAWAHGGEDVLGDGGGLDAGGFDAGGFDAGGFDAGGFDAGGFDANGADLEDGVEDGAEDGDGAFDGWGSGDDTGFDDDW